MEEQGQRFSLRYGSLFRFGTQYYVFDLKQIRLICFVKDVRILKVENLELNVVCLSKMHYFYLVFACCKRNNKFNETPKRTLYYLLVEK